MWVATKHGFFSAVDHRDIRDHVLVRARSKADLDGLHQIAADVSFGMGDGIPAPKVQKTVAHADYPFRLVMSKRLWGAVLEALGRDIDYDNFKNAVARKNPDRARLYHSLWAALHAIEREPTAGVYAAPKARKRKQPTGDVLI